MTHSKKRYGVGLLTPVLCLAHMLTLQSQTTSPKVDNFLKSLSTLASADAAREAFNMAKFSEAERRLLQNGLRDPKYSAPIQRLIKTVKAPPKALPATVTDLQGLATEQARKIGGVNQRLRTEAQSLLAVSAKLSSSAMQTIMGTAPKITPCPSRQSSQANSSLSGEPISSRREASRSPSDPRRSTEPLSTGPTTSSS